jgi:hypothetical protein
VTRCGNERARRGFEPSSHAAEGAPESTVAPVMKRRAEDEAIFLFVASLPPELVNDFTTPVNVSREIFHKGLDGRG